MLLNPFMRKLALIAHVTASVGWLGAIVGSLALSIEGVTSTNIEVVRASYLMLEMIGWYVLVPFSVASLATGLISSLGSKWGLIRHYWVIAKLVITSLASLILYAYTRTFTALGDAARDPTLTLESLQNPSPVLHASLAVIALLITTVLSIYKPPGMTARGMRKQEEQRALLTVESAR